MGKWLNTRMIWGGVKAATHERKKVSNYSRYRVVLLLKRRDVLERFRTRLSSVFVALRSNKVGTKPGWSSILFIRSDNRRRPLCAPPCVPFFIKQALQTPSDGCSFAGSVAGVQTSESSGNVPLWTENRRSGLSARCYNTETVVVQAEARDGRRGKIPSSDFWPTTARRSVVAPLSWSSPAAAAGR